jgi:hypothetical protein
MRTFSFIQTFIFTRLALLASAQDPTDGFVAVPGRDGYTSSCDNTNSMEAAANDQFFLGGLCERISGQLVESSLDLNKCFAFENGEFVRRNE